MFYSIGEVASMAGVPTSTLRYYDREGLLMGVKRSNGGIRVFSDAEVERLKVIECLKTAGMQIKDIKLFLDWCAEGDSTLRKRLDMFYERKAAVEKQMQDLQKTLDIIQYKIWYYATAVEADTEEASRKTPLDQMPEDALRGMRQLHSRHESPADGNE